MPRGDGVAPTASATPEAVSDGETGVLVASAAPDAVARAAWERVLAAPPAERARLANAARERVRAHRTPEALAAEYAFVYEGGAAIGAAGRCDAADARSGEC